MTRILSIAICLLAPVVALAGELRVQIADPDGAPVAHAVVALRPGEGALPPAPAVPVTVAIDQVEETFVPYVTAVQRGSAVQFVNSDPVSHQVYSFSGVKQFELDQDAGRVSDPILFDQPGIVAVGCNIHDHMLAFILVVETPYFAVTDAGGVASLSAPDGRYSVDIWQPQQRRALDPQPVTLAAAPAALALTLAVRPDPRRKHTNHDQQRDY